jgi:hypothetical protein
MRRTRTKLITGIVAAVIVLAAVPAASAALHARGAANCVRAQLGVRNNGTSGALGTIHGAWVFTNRSDTACTLNGYPDLQLYGPQGRPMPTTVVQDLSPAPSAVILRRADPEPSSRATTTWGRVRVRVRRRPSSRSRRRTPTRRTSSRRSCRPAAEWCMCRP